MANKNKIKGYIFEAFVRDDLRKAGLTVERMGQANQPDLIVDGFGVGEVKCWKQGIENVYRILGDKHFAVVRWQSPKARGKKPIVFMEYDLFKELLKKAIL